MKLPVIILISILTAGGLLAQSIRENVMETQKDGVNVEGLKRKVDGLKLETSINSNYVHVTNEKFSSFDSTLCSIDIKDWEAWNKHMEGVLEKVIPANVRERLKKLGEQDTKRALAIHVIMDVEQETGLVTDYMFLMSREIFDELTDKELQIIYNAFGRERMNSDLIEFRVLSPEQQQKINDKSFGRCANANAGRPAPLDVVPMCERKLVDRGKLSVPFLKLNMLLDILIKKMPLS